MAILDKLKQLFTGGSGGGTIPREVEEVSPAGPERAGETLESRAAGETDRASLATDEGYTPAERDPQDR